MPMSRWPQKRTEPSKPSVVLEHPPPLPWMLESKLTRWGLPFTNVSLVEKPNT